MNTANGMTMIGNRKRNRFGAFLLGTSAVQQEGSRSSGSTSGASTSQHYHDMRTVAEPPTMRSPQRRRISSSRVSFSFVDGDPLAADYHTESARTHTDADTLLRPADEAFGSDLAASENQEKNIDLITVAEETTPDNHHDDNDGEIVTARRLAENWQDHPSIRQTIDFQSWQVQDGRHIQSVLKDAAPYLASRLEFLQHTTPGKRRIKLVRSLNDDHGDEAQQEHGNNDPKIILIHPDAPPLSDLLSKAVDQRLVDLIRGGAITQGPKVPVTFTHQDFTVAYILARLLPPEVHPPPSAFETIGHVAHYNFKRHHWPYRFLIGAVTLSQLPIIETVIHKIGTVHGPYRTYRYELLAGDDRLYVTHTEASCKLQFDIAAVYWCSRLSEERQRLIQTEFRPHQIIADAFCGVGALCLQAVRAKQCTILANDWNAAAVRALHHNAGLNHATASFLSITEMDAYKFLVDLGLKQKSLPHHVVMNYPLEAPKFLGALRWWPTDSDVAPRVHVYTFCESADHALRQVAEALVPLTDESIFVDDDFASCDVSVHMVRDVTPNTTFACVSFSATSQLLKVVQGDFS